MSEASESTRVAEPSATVCLLDVDAELERAIPRGDEALARRTLTVHELALAPGAALEPVEGEAWALLVISGTLWREVCVAGGCAPQLLDGGAVVLCDPGSTATLTPTVTTVALSAVRLAVLDRRFLLAATRWPALMSAVHRRVADQQRDLATQAAIAHLPRVEERIEFLLWHLADRWGRVCADGVHLGLRLTHAVLGRFVGARRPTVSLALGQLRERGALDRLEDGTWVLLGEPPASGRGHGETPPPDLV